MKYTISCEDLCWLANMLSQLVGVPLNWWRCFLNLPFSSICTFCLVVPDSALLATVKNILRVSQQCSSNTITVWLQILHRQAPLTAGNVENVVSLTANSLWFLSICLTFASSLSLCRRWKERRCWWACCSWSFPSSQPVICSSVWDLWWRKEFSTCPGVCVCVCADVPVKIYCDGLRKCPLKTLLALHMTSFLKHYKFNFHFFSLVLLHLAVGVTHHW